MSAIFLTPDQDERQVRDTLRPRRRTRTRSRGTTRILVGQILVWVVVLGVWQILSVASPTAANLLGSPTGVLAALRDLAGSDGWNQVWITAQTALYGYLIGIALACVATAILVPFKVVMEFLNPFLVVVNALPRVAIAPIFILWLGIGVEAGVAFVVTTIFLIVFMNLYAGVRTIDTIYIENMTALGAGRAALLRQVFVPAVFGWLMASLRTAAAWALLGAALAEYLAGNAGLGYLLAQGGQLGEPNVVAAAGTLIALMALLVNFLLGLLERRLTRWKAS